MAHNAVPSRKPRSRRSVTQALAVLADKIGYRDLEEFLVYRYDPRATKAMTVEALAMHYH